MSDFLPTSYTVPDKSNGYMKFRQGENRFRILASPILGYEWWIDEDGKRKPMRVRMNGRVPIEFADTTKHFWAMPVWNYEIQQVQILEITQKGLQKTLASLAKHPKWGTPLGYDLLVERSGEGLETEYSLTPEPKEALDPEIQTVFNRLTINLEALYDGADPFAETVDVSDIDLGDSRLTSEGS